MTAEIALGTIVPSGNRMDERMTQAICAKLAGVVPLFTRIPVFGDTSPDKAAAGPYDWPAMLKAAELPSDAGPGALCCNGSKGGDRGFDIDDRLCADIAAATGIPAVTAARATLDLLRRLSVTRIALVTPYTRAGQARSIASFAAKGFDIVGERHAGMSDNLSQGAVPSDEIEAETSLPVVDSAAAGVWTASGPRASTRAPSGAGAASSPLTTSTGPARTGREGAGDGVPRRPPAGRLGHGLYRRTGAAS